MIEGHPRLGYLIVGSVLGTLALLGVLVVTLGGGGAGVRKPSPVYAPAPDAAQTGASVSAGGPAEGSAAPSRSGVRKVAPALRVSPVWATRTATRAGIPTPAITAYADAELRISKEQPGCHLGWNTLAGIGWIESHHGTIGDRTLGADGRSSSPIIGPALDGQGFAAIRSTPASASWHGDDTWEHAVGPLQFIASTWERWGSDGDGDGAADPLDLDDAAYTAARYLCADGKDLATAAGWSAAVHSYNHDQQYVLNVLSAANTYAERSRG